MTAQIASALHTLEDSPKIVLHGERYHLAPFTIEDVTPKYLGWLNDPRVNRFLEVRFSGWSFDKACAFVRSHSPEIGRYMWGIFAPEPEELIGTATLHDVSPHHGTAELGLMVGETAYWGRGASEEALALMIDFAFGPLGLRRVTGGTYATNHGMNFTYKRLGFRCEGKLRQAYSVGPERYVDGYRWGLLSAEWTRGGGPVRTSPTGLR